MGNEVELLKHWRELTPQKQQKVLEFVEQLKSESETTPPESDFVPQTPLGKNYGQFDNERSLGLSPPVQ
ncbi:MAG: hypothetical protein V7K14_00515 [Nostoc sp.]|uniref:hypothetical protein n=1 Tax=unclassified Nostoc TaxID=2593658 RepID=UPI0025F19354|nr:hypothetical protein [Nostoc sp. NMS7]